MLILKTSRAAETADFINGENLLQNLQLSVYLLPAIDFMAIFYYLSFISQGPMPPYGNGNGNANGNGRGIPTDLYS